MVSFFVLFFQKDFFFVDRYSEFRSYIRKLFFLFRR